MEKVLTLEPPEYERYLKNADAPLSPQEVNQPESFAYGVVNIVPTGGEGWVGGGSILYLALIGIGGSLAGCCCVHSWIAKIHDFQERHLI